MGYIGARIVYGYPFYESEVDWDFVEKDCGEDNETSYSLEDYFFNVVLEDICFTCTYCGERYDNELIFGEEFFDGEDVTEIDLDRIRSYADEETKERIAKDFKRFFPYLSNREPGFYLVTRYY